MPVSVTCPTCGHLWPWNARTAGRQARCRCGGLITFPAAAAVVPVEETAEPPVEDPWSEPIAVVGIEPAISADENSPLPIPLNVVPSPSKPRKPPLGNTLAYRSRGSHSPKPIDRNLLLLIGSPARDFWLPLSLVVVGALLYFGRTFYLLYYSGSIVAKIGPRSFSTALATACIQLLFNGFITVAVIVGFGKLMDMDYGTTTGTALKLAAVSIFPQAVSGIAFALVGSCAGLLAACIFSILFTISLGESLMCVVTATMLQVFSWMYVADVVDALFK